MAVENGPAYSFNPTPDFQVRNRLYLFGKEFHWAPTQGTHYFLLGSRFGRCACHSTSPIPHPESSKKCRKWSQATLGSIPGRPNKMSNGRSQNRADTCLKWRVIGLSAPPSCPGVPRRSPTNVNKNGKTITRQCLQKCPMHPTTYQNLSNECQINDKQMSKPCKTT